MSTTPSWYNSNTLAGLNHFLYNVDRPFNWVDDKINPARYTNWGDKLHGDARMHGGDTVATLAAVVAAYYGAAEYGAEGAGEGAGAGLGADAGFEAGEYGAGSGALDGAAGGAAGGLGSDAGFEGGEYGAGDGSLGADEGFEAGEDGSDGSLGANQGFEASEDAPKSNMATYGKYMQQAGKMMQQQAQAKQQQLHESNVYVTNPPLENKYATSTKTAKTSPHGNVRAAIARGAAGSDPIDANGMEIASIQQLAKRLSAAKARLAQLQGARK